MPQENADAANGIKQAAHDGNFEAQFEMGQIYRRGEGVAKDRTKAAEWYQKAAAQGHVLAQSMLDNMYDNGDGFPRGDEDVVEWYQRRAVQGNASSQFSLGCLFALGRGVTRDMAKADEWYCKAASQGDIRAQSVVEMWASGESIPDDETSAVKWLKQAVARAFAAHDHDSRKTEERRNLELLQEYAAQGGSRSDNYMPQNDERAFESVQKRSILENAFEIYYHRFPTEDVFEPAKILSQGISEEVYEEIRRGHASLMAGVEAGGAWFRSGFVPLIFVLSIIGIPFLLFFVWSDGMMRRRARNAAILAFRSAAQRDPDYKKYLSGNLFSITTQHFDSVF